MFPPDLRPPPEPLGFSARPSPTPGALGVPRPNGGRPLGRSGFSARPRAPGVPHPTSARAIFGFPPDHRPPRCPCLPPRLRPPPGVPVLPRPPPAPGLTRAPPPDLRARGTWGSPPRQLRRSPAPPPERGPPPRPFGVLSSPTGLPGFLTQHLPGPFRFPARPPPAPVPVGFPPDSARPRDHWDSPPIPEALGVRRPPPTRPRCPRRFSAPLQGPLGSPPPYGAP